MKLLPVPWLELKMSLLVDNKSYPSWDGQTVRQFPAIPVMSSNSFLLCFISPFFIFTTQYFSISWYLLPFSLNKYLTTCYLASYSAPLYQLHCSVLLIHMLIYLSRLQVSLCKTPLTNLLMMHLVLVNWPWHSWLWHTEHIHDPLVME